MAESSSSGAGAPNLNLTPEEKRVYGQLFRQADTEGVGVVTGDVAVKFFEKTRLESRILGEIWQIADRENVGFLTPAGFGIVLRLIGHGQAGREPTPELALQPGPLPRFDGINIPGVVSQTTGSGTAPPLQSQGTGGGGVRIPPLTPDKAAQFASLFERQSLLPGNILPGDQAKQIFEKSGLPNEVLGGIWQLADTEQRGALVLTEFVIAMHLLTSVKHGHMRVLPNVVPAGLYEAATRRPNAIPRQQSPIGGPSPISAIPRQLSGQAQRRTGSPLGRPQAQQPPPPQQASDWLIAPADKVHFDRFFEELDNGKRGFITGEEAVAFFSRSKLPEDTLAQIWDLADTTSAGRLNKDEFSVAMYLIRQQRSNRDGPNPLPVVLPPNLVPPSMRAQMRAQPPPAAVAETSPFDPPSQPPPPPAPPKSALDDLFGLDSSPMPTAAPTQAAMTTGGSNDPFGSNASPAPASPAKPSPTASSFVPFVPSSSFGRTLAVHATGASTGSAGGGLPRTQTMPTQSPSVHDDLLGGGDESSQHLSNDATELANLSNQIGSLTKHMHEVQGQRTTTQNELSQANQQKKNFEQRLSQLRTLYEKEAKDVRALEEQLAASRSDTRKLTTEMAMLDGTLQDLRTQHHQVSTALQADQQENANLKERIRAVNAEVAALKPQIEKLKSEARQQKGLVAINKKQLATNEAERDKLRGEAEALAKSNEEMARQINAASPASTAAAGPPAVASPALSTSSANNPFFRRTGSTDIMGAFSSVSPPPPPPAKTFSDRSFDDVFGPSPAPQAAGVAPAAFLPQNTGASTGSASSFATPATSNTPTVSRQATLGASEPPAPPESRQLSSSFLPFGDVPESLTSSRQVSPPLSRTGRGDTPLGASSPPPALEATPTGQSTATVASGPQKPAGGDGRPTSSGSGPLFGGQQARGHSDSLSGPFAAVDHAKAKEDFESAFASFKNSHPKSSTSPSADFATGSGVAGGSTGGEPAAKGLGAFSTEFPPISELERDDDDDDSGSDTDNGGFEDDFAPVSPKPAPTTAGATATAKSPSVAAPSAPGIDSATRGISPVADTSSSSVSTAMPQAPTSAAAGSSSADSIFGGGSPALTPSTGTTAEKGEPQPQQQQGGPHLSDLTNGPPQSSAAAAKKISFDDDLSDDFEGLEDANEGSTVDDDFANISRSALDDYNYNPVFDSSPPQSHAARSDDHGFASPAANPGAPPAPGIASSQPPPPFGAAESGGSFDLVGGSSASLANASPVGATNGPVPVTGATAKAPADGNHDWDALFASLDDPAAPAAPPAAAGASEPTQRQQAPAALGLAGSPGSPSVPSRPTGVGRALTEEGLHDDPILKNLTGMGYSRKDAVSALEKYDYNLERAANYLASQS